MSILEIKDLSVSYLGDDYKVRAVDHVSLNIEEGESLGIVGESGSGKSTLMLGILRLLNERTSKTEGEALFRGNDLISMNKKELAKVRWSEISVVFQKAMNVFSPVHTIETFLSDIYKVHRPNAKRQEIRKELTDLLAMVNLPKQVLRMYPHELSGGMLQRTSIAMSLMFRPKILVLDEATTALDVITQNQILSEILEIEEKLHLTRVLITHDMSVVANFCKKIAVFYAGRLMEVGYVEDVLVHPRHPYTRDLVKSYPTFSEDGTGTVISIPGTMIDLKKAYTGCPYANRCDRATEQCRTDRPMEDQMDEHWSYYCHNPLQGGETDESR